MESITANSDNADESHVSANNVAGRNENSPPAHASASTSAIRPTDSQRNAPPDNPLFDVAADDFVPAYEAAPGFPIEFCQSIGQIMSDDEVPGYSPETSESISIRSLTFKNKNGELYVCSVPAVHIRRTHINVSQRLVFDNINNDSMRQDVLGVQSRCTFSPEPKPNSVAQTQTNAPSPLILELQRGTLFDSVLDRIYASAGTIVLDNFELQQGGTISFNVATAMHRLNLIDTPASIINFSSIPKLEIFSYQDDPESLSAAVRPTFVRLSEHNKNLKKVILQGCDLVGLSTYKLPFQPDTKGELIFRDGNDNEVVLVHETKPLSISIATTGTTAASIIGAALSGFEDEIFLRIFLPDQNTEDMLVIVANLFNWRHIMKKLAIVKFSADIIKVIERGGIDFQSNFPILNTFYCSVDLESDELSPMDTLQKIKAIIKQSKLPIGLQFGLILSNADKAVEDECDGMNYNVDDEDYPLYFIKIERDGKAT